MVFQSPNSPADWQRILFLPPPPPQGSVENPENPVAGGWGVDPLHPPVLPVHPLLLRAVARYGSAAGLPRTNPDEPSDRLVEVFELLSLKETAEDEWMYQPARLCVTSHCPQFSWWKEACHLLYRTYWSHSRVSRLFNAQRVVLLPAWC